MKKKIASPYKKLSLVMLNAIVSKPEEIEILEEEGDDGLNLSIKVAKDDMGRVIGKEGKIIKAIRNMLRIRAIKEGKHINVQLVEE